MNLFNPSRFMRLLRAHFAESWRGYAWLLSVAAMLDFIFIALVFALDSRRKFSPLEFDAQVVWYSSGLFIVSAIFAGLHFRSLSSPGSALITLMRPASHCEKWLMTFCVVGIFVPLAYTLVYAFLHLPAASLAQLGYQACSSCKEAAPDFRIFIPFLSTLKDIHDAELHFVAIKMQIFTMLVLWSIQALLIGGTLFFKRYPVLQTLVALFLLGIVAFTVGEPPAMGAFWSANIDQYSQLEIGISFALWVLLPILLWGSVYFHLKERELN